jgi:hypothetical protein
MAIAAWTSGCFGGGVGVVVRGGVGRRYGRRIGVLDYGSRFGKMGFMLDGDEVIVEEIIWWTGVGELVDEWVGGEHCG